MLGTPIYKDIKRLSKLPVDVHIMSYRPEEYMEYYDIQPGDRISSIPKQSAQPYKLLQTIRDKGCKAGLVLNPGTPVSYLEECMDLLDYVTLMTVNPALQARKWYRTHRRKYDVCGSFWMHMKKKSTSL